MSGARLGLGLARKRLEDARFLTGTGRYTDDVAPAGQAAAVVVRSPHAHARIRAIDVAAALPSPGVLGVFTAADLDADGIGDIPCKFQVKNRDGTRMPTPPRPVLARDRVRFVGEPVAFVVAETLDQARDAAERVEVDYAPLPAVTAMDDALAPGAPAIHEGVAGNLLFDWEMGSGPDVAAAFARAARIVSLDLINNRLAPVTLEPRGVIAFEEDGRLTVTTGSQGSHTLREWLAEDVLHIPPERLRVISPDVGGGFGMRLFLYPEHALIPWAARRLGRPVRWIGERSESFLTDCHGRDHQSRAELALDGDGRFLALRVSTLANVGAALSQYGAFIPTHAGTGMLPGVYAIPALYARVRGVLTNTAPVDAYRGAGRPEAAYLIERLVDRAARAMGLPPDEIRRRNFIPPEAMPHRTAGGKTYDSGDFARVLDAALLRSDWAGFPVRRAEAVSRGKLRGIGLATYIETSGGSDGETAEIRVGTEGKVTVLIGTQSTGQGHETAYAQMAAEGLGIPIERVEVHQGDTDRVATGGGTGASRSLPVGGAALAMAVDALIAQGGAAREGASAKATFTPTASTYPNGCHVSEVEVDPETGAVALIAHTIVDDVGVTVNPLLLEGQIVGGAVQAIGQALFEEVVYDRESGQLPTGSLIDYALPRAADVPVFRFSTLNTPCRTNPLGIKGAGEAGTIGAAPAVINALLDALSPLGVDRIDMPATPLRVWQSIQEAAGQEAAGRPT